MDWTLLGFFSCKLSRRTADILPMRSDRISNSRLSHSLTFKSIIKKNTSKAYDNGELIERKEEKMTNSEISQLNEEKL